MTCLTCIFNTVVADDLAMQGAMALAAMDGINLELYQNILISGPKGLSIKHQAVHRKMDTCVHMYL